MTAQRLGTATAEDAEVPARGPREHRAGGRVVRTDRSGRWHWANALPPASRQSPLHGLAAPLQCQRSRSATARSWQVLDCWRPAPGGDPAAAGVHWEDSTRRRMDFISLKHQSPRSEASTLPTVAT